MVLFCGFFKLLNVQTNAINIILRSKMNVKSCLIDLLPFLGIIVLIFVMRYFIFMWAFQVVPASRPLPSNSIPSDSLAVALQRALADRSRAIHSDSSGSSSGEDEEDDDEWED